MCHMRLNSLSPKAKLSGGHNFNLLDTRLAMDSRHEVYQFLAKYLNPHSPPK